MLYKTTERHYLTINEDSISYELSVRLNKSFFQLPASLFVDGTPLFVLNNLIQYFI